MNKRSYSLRRRAVAILATLAMVLSLFAATTATAFAAPAGPPALPTFSGGTGTVGAAYQIATVSDLVALSNSVNAGNSYSGDYFELIDDLDLNGMSWTPIGYGEGTTSGSRPFAGYFSGYDSTKNVQHTISGMTIYNPSSLTGIGLFGNVADPGQIANIILTNGFVAISGAGNYVGAVVGYTNGSVVNCQSDLPVNASGSTNVGGVVGAVESTEKEQISPQVVVQYCTSTGNVTGESRVGGIVGASYCQYAGNTAIDYCSYTGGTITGTRDSRNVYGGGVVGYSSGWVSRSYAYNITLQNTAKGNYFGGVAGLLQGTDPTSSIYFSYSYVATYGSDLDPQYDTPFVSRVDDSYDLPMFGDTWVENQRVNNYHQPETYVDAGGWGLWTAGTGLVTDPTLSPNNLNSKIDVLNGTGSGDPYYTGATPPAPAYPQFGWQVTGVAPTTLLPYTPALTPGGTPSLPGGDDITQIFFDPNADPSDPTNDGSYGHATSVWATAFGAVSGSRNIIYILNTVPLPTGETLPLTNTSATTIKRSGTNAGYLFEVTGGTLTADSSITIDGNNASYVDMIRNPLIHVISGTFTQSGATLTSNYAANGGAIRADGGTVNLTGGMITTNKADLNGGAIAAYDGATVTISGGTISNNDSLNNGGAVATFTGATATVSGTASITQNTASASGGGVFAGSGGTIAINGGTITGNTAVYGGGASAKGSGTTPGTPDAVLTMSGGTIGSGNGNTATSYGGGVDVDLYSSFEMTGGAISGNTAEANGGGVAIIGSDASNRSVFTQSGTGTISGNKATTFGGGVSINVYSTYNLNGGTVGGTGVGNTAGSDGGGVYVGGIFSGIFNMTAGTISGNSATGLGAGVYDSETFNITPTTGATFDIVDTIYLTSGTYINVGATVDELDSKLTVQLAGATSGQPVAQGTTAYPTFTLDDLNYGFQYVDSSHTLTRNTGNTQIVIS